MRLISRTAVTKALRTLLREYPVVSILGPRQAGKTTIVHQSFPKASYWDLDLPSDRGRLEVAPEDILRNASRIMILDEAQRVPGLFPILRALVDESRRKKGRFLLLGSASPELVRGISESLAGRIAFLELPPFSWPEVSRHARNRMDRLWLRGGFPEAYLSSSEGTWFRWMENYSRTFIERDLGLMGYDLPAARFHRFTRLLTHLHGGIWNASDIAGSLGVSYHTVQKYAEVLERAFLVRFLRPWHANLGKRLIRSPKIYWRDTGLYHYHLGLMAPAEIRDHPKSGASWEGFIIEEVLRREREHFPASEGYFFRTQTGLECDLLLARPGKDVIPIEIKLSTSPGRDDADRIRAVARLLKVPKCHIISNVKETTVTGDLTIWRADELLSAGKWGLK